jgi:pyruvate dehydrogenase E2 component (dihydrolipoamide acetyltransferase)
MEDKGVDASVFQSLKKGRVTEADVRRYLGELLPTPPSPPALPKAVEKGEISGIRKRVAGRMSLSKQTIPHFYLRVAVDATAMIRLHRTLPFKPAYNDLIIKACSMAMVEFPDVNVSIVDNIISRHQNCNVGLAVSLDQGLIVPVVHAAQVKSLEAISILTNDLILRARVGKLTLDDVTGGTFTITSLGVHPIEEFSAIINIPEGAILAVGRILLQPVVTGQQIVPGHVLKLTLSVDHRIIDGRLAAQFLSRIKELLEAGDPLAD